MKKNILLILSLGIVFTSIAQAKPRDSVFSNGVIIDNGNSRVPFVVSLTSSSWTAILSEDSNRRYAIIQTSASATSDICLSTTTSSATGCSATTPGVKLGTIFDYFEDFNQAPLYGKVFEAGNSLSVYGEYQRDNRDTAVND